MCREIGTGQGSCGDARAICSSRAGDPAASIGGAEIVALVTYAAARARAVAGGRLHDDDCQSEAGLAVAVALQKHDPSRASLKTHVALLVRWGVLRQLRANRKYRHKSEAWWNSLVTYDPEPDDPGSLVERLVEAGASRAELVATGVPAWRAQSLIASIRGKQRCADASLTTG